MTSRWRGLISWTVTTLVLAGAIHCAAVLMYPRALMAYVERKIIKEHGKNAFRHGSRPAPKDRVVVLPSPDLIYSVAVFDVSEGPLHITAPLTGWYMSLSLYADNSDNFFVQNDRQIESGKFDVVLAGSKASDVAVNGAQLVRAPSNKGIVLIRYFAGEGTHGEEIATRQKEIRCTTVGP